MKAQKNVVIQGGYFSKAELTALAKIAARGHGTAYCFLIGIFDRVWEKARPSKPFAPRKISKKSLLKMVQDELANIGRYPTMIWNSFVNALKAARYAN